MTQAFQNSRSKGVVTSSLRYFREQGQEDIYSAGLEKVPLAERARVEAAMQKQRRTKEFLGQRKQARLDEESWSNLLTRRQLVTGPPTDQDKLEYRKRTQADKQRLRSKFPALTRAQAANDNTWRSNVATRFEAWCREDSWTMCRKCHRMEPRTLKEVDISGKRGRQTHTVKQCKHCAHGVGYPTVQLDDIPPVLRGLSQRSLWAITPLEIFNGEAVWAKHGYRVHTDMTRFWWRPKSVLDQIVQLLDEGHLEDAERAEAAYDYLKEAEGSSWWRFCQLHGRFLRKNESRLTGEIENDWRVLQLPRACIEEVGIECALWPHLYPRTNMCETHIRASHHTREGKPTRTVFDKKTVRARDKALREQREAAISQGRLQGKQHHLPLQRQYENMIRRGQKTVEGRLNKGVAARIKAGDTLMLGSTSCLVKGVYRYPCFGDMLWECGLERVLPGCPSIEAGIQVYHGFPGYRAGEAAHGVVAFDLEPCGGVSQPKPAAKPRPKRERSSSSSSGSSSSGSGSTSAQSSSCSDKEDSEHAPLDFARHKQNSAKASYLAKVLGPVAEYGANYDLFQFVYDLWLWSAVGAKKNKGIRCPLHLAMSQYSFSPEYWQIKHAGLMDMVRQLGVPTLFITIAPYEWSFPMHRWVEDELHKQMRSKLHLPVAETLHIAHVLGQAVEGLITGANQQSNKGRGKPWSSHIFAAKDGSKKNTVINYFGRLEFQDGKRKRYVNMKEAATQFYHGRGTVHLHLLVWLEYIEKILLEKVISARSPADNGPLRDLVEGSQRSYTGSGWKQQDAPSHWDAGKKLLRLQHLVEDYCQHNSKGCPEGVRAYMQDLISSLFCHMDVLSADGRAALLRYVSSYVSKFSDSFTSEWMNEAASGYEISRRVLTDYHPLEPEMVLQLGMQWFPQVFAGGTMQRFVVPVPFKAEVVDRVQQYMDCAWRTEDMTLFQFLRKTNTEGCIHRALKKRWQAATQAKETEEPLERWAIAQPERGDTLIAAAFLSRYNDEYYGQWLLMNRPFRKLEDFLSPELDRVPPHLYYQTMAYVQCPEYWCNEAAVRAGLELDAFNKFHVQNIWSMVKGNQEHIRKYLDGTFDMREEGADGAASPDAKPVLEQDQRNIVAEILWSVEEGWKQRQLEEDRWKGGPEEAEAGARAEEEPDPFAKYTSPSNTRQAFAVLGPAGSGKTSCIEEAVEEVERRGGRILIVAPTGKLAARFRQKYPHLDVDTVHGAFHVWKPIHQTMELMMGYDLVIAEEVGQLSRDIFERLMQLWLHGERLTTLVFVGDFWQLEGVDPSRASDSPMWRNGMVRKKELYTMRRCKCKLLAEKLRILRTGKPTFQQLKSILRGHKAPVARRQARMTEPTAYDVKKILEETPQTVFLTSSKRSEAKLNRWAVEALFAEERPLCYLPMDTGGDEQVEVEEAPVYKGMRVTLTKNQNKKIGFVNGMGAEVISKGNAGLFVWTDQGKRIMITPWTNEHGVIVYPFRLGYASTLHKVQGATLKHITLWLDIPNLPASAYVALSRVQRDADWRFIGNPCRHHFTPARFD